MALREALLTLTTSQQRGQSPPQLRALQALTPTHLRNSGRPGSELAALTPRRSARVVGDERPAHALAREKRAMSPPIKGGDGVGNLVIQREMGDVDAALLALERDALVRTDGPTDR
jgi:hypothetical protein